ncbi:GAF domain-containing protein [Hymenobacter chitinivorans]|uniref:GAF domain-containing protein n=1 Tax=Hymenobacter chitinivorans DSM 11115 TaxID=1121954 RepID=A0A2M9BNS2_9BACT|nr:GAF domain-containing protein [Hymenobacter chitinivorans]PJJ59593.1 GAF domain-containing protein [Hymenobacter chitinivorans DSM 11115]
MNSLLIPSNESARLRAVARYRCLGNLHEQVFDELVALAASLCRVPISFLSLVEAESVWFRNTAGWTGAEHLPRDYSLCSVAILQDEATVFEDLRKEPCQLIQSAEIELLNLQFFVGIPLKTADGFNIGVLAIADHCPQAPKPEDQRLLEAYSRLTVSLLELNRAENQSAPIASGVYEAVEDAIRWMQTLSATLLRTTLPTVAEVSRVKQIIGQEADDTARRVQDLLGPWHTSPGAA